MRGKRERVPGSRKRTCREAFAIAFCAFLLGAGVSRGGELSEEFNADASYVGGAPTHLDHSRVGDVSEEENLVHFAVSKQIGDGPMIRVGAEWEHFSFGLPSAAPLPDTLQGVSLILGVDLELFNWLVRIEAQPGLYGATAGLNGKDFNVPWIIGGSYIVSPDLQWVLGLSFDADREWVVLPGIGLRWKMAEKWTLNAIPPNPRLEYALTPSCNLYAGGDFKDGTFRASDSFGNAHGRPRLDNAVVEYDEFRVGVGVDWKISDSFTFDAETGYMPYRDFDFHRAGAKYQTYSGAAYGQIALSAKF